MVYRRLLALFSAIMLHLAIGSVYAWSVLTMPIIDKTQWTFAQVATVFGLTIATLGFSAAFLGDKVRQWGAKKSCLISAVLFFSGLVFSSMAIWAKNIYLLYIAYGIVVGIGTGIAYLTPIPILMTWYPNNKGFATGLVVSGFGLSGLLAGYGYHYLINRPDIGLDFTPAVVGVISLLMMSPSIFFLRPNPEAKGKLIDSKKKKINKFDVLKKKDFRLLWIIFFLNIFVGIAALSVMSPMLTDMFKISSFEAAKFVSLIAIVNGFSRCLWSTISDSLGRPLTFVMMVFLETSAMLAMACSNDYNTCRVCLIVLISGYGGMFATMPGYLADLFGVEKLPDVLGMMLTAWGIAGFFGPKVIALCLDMTGQYNQFFVIAAVMMAINLVLSILMSNRNILKF